MTDIVKVLELTKTTFKLYNNAINEFNQSNYSQSCTIFEKVIFNLYDIKRQLLNSSIEIKEKTKLYPKIRNALEKSFEYAKELDMMDNNNNDSDEERSNDILSTECNTKKIKDYNILIDAFEGDIINLENKFKNSNNFDLDITNNLGETPLHIVVRNGDTRMTEILLKNGANINSVTKYGLTPIEISCINKDFKMISLLQDYGCKLEKLITIRDQNSDPSILKSSNIDLIAALKNLEKLLNPLSISKFDCFFKLKEFVVQTSISSKKKVKILNNLDYIERNDTLIGWDEYKESDVLQIVWNAIFSDYFKESSKDIIKILIEEIYYSLDQKNLIVCPSTKYERLLYCLAGFNPAIFQIRNECILNQEMILFSLNFRNVLLNSFDKNFASTYNASIHTEEQLNKIDKFNIIFKNKLKEKLDDIYVKSGILMQKELIMILNRWIDLI